MKLDCLHVFVLLNYISTKHVYEPRTAVVHLIFRAGSTFPFPVWTVPSSMDRTSQCNKVDAVRLYASYRLTLLLLKGQRCVKQNSVYKTNLKILKQLHEDTCNKP